MTKFEELTKTQQSFIEQMARKKLVEWCDRLMRERDPKGLIPLDPEDPYVHYASTRPTPWISLKEPSMFRILGSGWSAAASFLKR